MNLVEATLHPWGAISPAYRISRSTSSGTSLSVNCLMDRLPYSSFLTVSISVLEKGSGNSVSSFTGMLAFSFS
ncbi:MAG: hypothetical protein NWE87_08345, partial [Candidatus Bathyarchaeota archaeon]|nr:hypothetical protein [Candidatus Bathyarchaeota archaeon]